jgi:hypothetical protein
MARVDFLLKLLERTLDACPLPASLPGRNGGNDELRGRGDDAARAEEEQPAAIIAICREFVKWLIDVSLPPPRTTLATHVMPAPTSCVVVPETPLFASL